VAIVESRVKKGELTFTTGTPPGTPTSFACQASNVRVTPSYDDDGDAVETLCGDEIPAGKKESWVIQGTSIQDFDDPDGFLTFCFENRMSTVPFEWTPNIEGAPVWAGSAVIVALEEGGDVNTRLTTDWSFDLSGEPTRTYGTTGTQAPESAAA
jgi:hypothetical protein